jgi:acyl-CoA thioester hydrolase
MYPTFDEAIAPFKVVIEIPVAWGEMDAFQHVNNIVYFRYFESARIAYFERAGWVANSEPGQIGPILASTSCSFKFPLTYPDTIAVGARITKIETDRISMHSRVVSRRYGRIAAENEAVIVSYDYARRRRAPLPDAIRQAIEALEQL